MNIIEIVAKKRPHVSQSRPLQVILETVTIVFGAQIDLYPVLFFLTS